MTTQNENDIVPIAKVGATYRLKGELKLHVLSDSIETALSYGQWYAKRPSDKTWTILEGEKVSQSGDKVLIQFSDASVKEIAAAKYTNTLIGVPRLALNATDEDEYYWVDLIGMEVKNKEGLSFGKIEDVLDTGANEVLCCKHKEKQYLIPFINDYVIEVDRKNKNITVDWQYDYI